MMRRAFVVALGLMGVAAPNAFANVLDFEGPALRCDFDAVEEAGQPARRVEVRPGLWDDARDVFDWFEDGEPVSLWVEEGLPDCPVWPPAFIESIGGLSFQRWGCGDKMRMLTFSNRDGRAVLSGHAVEGEPPRLVVFTVTGTCVILDEG